MQNKIKVTKDYRQEDVAEALGLKRQTIITIEDTQISNEESLSIKHHS